MSCNKSKKVLFLIGSHLHLPLGALLLFSIVLGSILSCSSPVQKTETYKLDVPYDKQAENTWCVPASVLMCSRYFAEDVGWSDSSIPTFDSPSIQNFINTKLTEYGGTTFWRNSQDGAPKSISKFLCTYLNIKNTRMAILDTSSVYDSSIVL